MKSLGNSISAAQSEAIRSGTFYGMALGDYWTIDGVNWRIADFDYLIRSDSAEIDGSKHHLIIVPDKLLYEARMNPTNTSKGGYTASEMRRSSLDRARNMIKSAFGAEHILPDYGVELMTKDMVFGSGKKTLSLFRVHPASREASGWYWLQDVVSSANFANVGRYGVANDINASFAGGVRPVFAIY